MHIFEYESYGGRWGKGQRGNAPKFLPEVFCDFRNLSKAIRISTSVGKF